MPRGRELLICASAALVVLLSRLAHLDILWVEEAYGIAAARELLGGKALYRDIWFDKPPGYALYYAVFQANSGWVLRVAGTAFVLVSAYAAGSAAGRLWTRRERAPAFVFTCGALTFWIPSAVQAVTPDLLIVPLLLGSLAALLARRPVVAGVLSSTALWCNSKTIVLAAPILLWCTELRIVCTFLAGFSALQVAGWLLLDSASYVAQVWTWGMGYSKDTFLASPVLEFFRRTGAWAWFHSSLLICALRSSPAELRLIAWLIAALVAVCAGARFFPRYYFALLPPIVLLAARGWVLSGRWMRVAVLLLSAVPIVRFGPKYVQLLAGDAASTWSDLSLMRDSRTAARLISERAQGRPTLLVWGYRPDVYAFSKLRAGTPFLDSQPLNGVLADRHLTEVRPTFPEIAAANRRRLLQLPPPTYIVDGLGPLNPSLAIDGYDELLPLLSRYRVVAKTAFSVIYELQSSNK